MDEMVPLQASARIPNDPLFLHRSPSHPSPRVGGRLAWKANRFTSDAGWSGGDFNADGVTDGRDLWLWNANKFTNSFGSVDGDFNDDELFNDIDIDLFFEIAAGTDDPDFVLTGDGFVDLADRDAWLAEAGEANLGAGLVYFIGSVHRMAAALDGQIELVAGAFSADAEKSRLSGADLFLDPKRIYASYQEMAQLSVYEARWLTGANTRRKWGIPVGVLDCHGISAARVASDDRT